MSASRRTRPVGLLGRSSHTAFIDSNVLYVWGGNQAVAGETNNFPSDEIWLCDLDDKTWEKREITGEKLPDLSGFCGSFVNGTLYIFGGSVPRGYTNQMFSVDLTEQPYLCKRVTATKGTPPPPRSKHSCWVHRGRLIYFGGYGCKTLAQNTSSTDFIVEEMSWKRIDNALFKCWGWNNDVDVFDTRTAAWSVPETQGPVPCPRGCHASAVLGNKGYVSGGLRMAELDMFCLDLETWTWTQFDLSELCAPLGRCMFTMTPISDQSLFIYGGLGISGYTLNEAWQFNTLKSTWTRVAHPHKDKPRVCHTACRGSDGDVVVFGGSSNTHVIDSVAGLFAPLHHHYNDMFIFQTQPYSLFRLCEDLIRRNLQLFGEQLNLLPSNLCSKIDKPLFSATASFLTA